VIIGEQDLRGLDLRSWRTQVAWVPQRPYLFAWSLRDNIALGRPAAERDLIAHAVDSAGLGCLVDRLPAGLDTEIGENGYGLSAGERQRVALARAFLVDAPLLVLDEPTAHLDGETEQAVLSAVQALTAGRTVVMAAHRHALLDLADAVVHVDRTRMGAPL
jgi:ABC-type transport system involved in cytochrome bd biosynthesis fused ATPase/permease subunit